jgi:hypothetical protein
MTTVGAIGWIQHNTLVRPRPKIFYFILFYIKQKPVHTDHADDEDHSDYVNNKNFLDIV